MKKSTKKHKLDELIDNALNLIGQNTDKDDTTQIKSRETSDQRVLRTRQKRNPLGGYGMGGSYGYFYGEAEQKNDNKIITEDNTELEIDEKFKEWLKGLKTRLVVRELIKPNVELDAKSWKMYYDEGLNPAEAIVADLGKAEKLYNPKFDPTLNEKKVNPWAVCTSSVGREDKQKYEDCVMGIKKKQGMHESVDNRVKKIMEDLLDKRTNENDIEEKPTITEIPSFESLMEHHPIIATKIKELIQAIKERGVDNISDAIIVNEILNGVDFSSIPQNLKKSLIRKMQGYAVSNGVVNEEKVEEIFNPALFVPNIIHMMNKDKKQEEPKTPIKKDITDIQIGSNITFKYKGESFKIENQNFDFTSILNLEIEQIEKWILERQNSWIKN